MENAKSNFGFRFYRPGSLATMLNTENQWKNHGSCQINLYSINHLCSKYLTRFMVGKCRQQPTGRRRRLAVGDRDPLEIPTEIPGMMIKIMAIGYGDGDWRSIIGRTNGFAIVDLESHRISWLYRWSSRGAWLKEILVVWAVFPKKRPRICLAWP